MSKFHTGTTLRLNDYRPEFNRGQPAIVEAAWLIISWLFVESFIPGSRHRVFLLRLFGARIAAGAIVKPGCKIKLPWRLSVGESTWIGENVWIDNLAHVSLGSNTCISQGAYLCTGSHDWKSPTFELKLSEIIIEDGVWICARAVIGPGVTIGANGIVGLGAVATADVEAKSIILAKTELADRRRIIHV